MDQALAHTLEVLISLREAAIEDCCQRMVDYEVCLAEMVDRFVAINDPNREVTHKVYDSMFRSAFQTS